MSEFFVQYQSVDSPALFADSILVKLRQLGWGEEIDRLPVDLYPLSDHAHVRVARDMTERSASTLAETDA